MRKSYDYLDNKLPNNSADLIDRIDNQISVITRMELLSWHKATSKQIQVLQDFITGSAVFGLDEKVILKAIDIRKNYRLKLPDAIIAATALANGLVLISHNISDFKNISGLRVIDPWNL
ncbi:MAG: type II toxin-antitoxin system VapC family toxin [Bacteroidota bacterium]